MDRRRVGHAGVFALDDQRFHVGFFDTPTTGAVDQQAPCRGGQEGPGFLDSLRLGQHQDTDECVVGQVGGVLGATEFPAQPAMQPTMVLAVHRRKGLLTR